MGIRFHVFNHTLNYTQSPRKMKLEKCRHHCLLIAALLAACTATAPPSAPATDPNPILVTINAKSLHWGDLKAFLDLNLYHLPDEEKAVPNLDSMVEKWLDHELLLSAAEQDGVSVSEDETAAWIRWITQDTALSATLATPTLSLETWKRYQRERLMTRTWAARRWPLSDEEALRRAKNDYDTHLDRYTRAEAVRIRHLVTNSDKKATDLRARLIAGENFAKLAIHYSQSPDRVGGGEIGPFVKGELPGIFDTHCFELPIGELSPVIKSDYGYHLCKVLERRAAHVRPFAEVEALLVREMKDEWLAKNGEQWLKPQREHYTQILDWRTIRDLFGRTLE